MTRQTCALPRLSGDLHRPDIYKQLAWGPALTQRVTARLAAVQTIRDMFNRYTKRANAEAAAASTRLQYIVIDLSS